MSTILVTGPSGFVGSYAVPALLAARRDGGDDPLADRLASGLVEGLEGGSTAIRIDELPGETAFVEIGAPLVTGVHHVERRHDHPPAA